MLVKDTLFSKKKLLNCNGKLIDLNTPKVMAILNVTPDSFYTGSRFSTEDEIKKRTLQCVKEGADIIDVGAYSSRPGAMNISTEEEKNRLDKALRTIKSIAPDIIISVDTFRSGIAETVVKEFGVNIINDISGGNIDVKMFDVIANLNVPYIIMHMKGIPENMQVNPQYSDVMQELIAFFSQKTNRLTQLGIKDIVIDPGFGFGKTLENNYTVLSELENFKIFPYPLMVGVSRKSMIYRTLNLTPEEALNGTSALHMAALMKGADILRVHDVKEAKQVVSLYVTMTENKAV